MNKEGIKASLYLPKECLDIIVDRQEEVKNYLDTCFGNNIGYDIYLGDYNGKEVCAIDVKLLNRTCKDVKNDYKQFKAYLKELTHKQPKQVLMFRFRRI